MSAPEFMLAPLPQPWLGGEPRTLTVHQDDAFPKRWPAVQHANLIDVAYGGGGLSQLLEDIAARAGVASGSFQALLENLEDLSKEKPLVVVVRQADRLLADVGPAILHLLTAWESFTHHGSGESAMYLVLETGSSAVVNRAFFPGGPVDWLPRPD